MSITTIHTWEIAKILVKDKPFLDSYHKFASILKVVSTKNLEDEYRRTNLPAEALFTNILNSWVQTSEDETTVQKLSELLKAEGFQNCVDLLEDEVGKTKVIIVESQCPSNSTDPPPNLDFDLIPSPPVDNFVGRGTEIEQLYNAISSFKSDRGPKKRKFSITGLPGVGKTQLLKRLLEDRERKLVSWKKCWLMGDKPESFISSLVKFSESLNVERTGPLKLEEVVKNICSKISKQNWIIIVDNVDSAFKDLISTLNVFQKCGGVFIILTSRKTTVLPGEMEEIPLKELDESDAVLLIKEGLKIERKSGEILVAETIYPPAPEVLKLCKTLQNFPLALQQALAFILEQRRTTTQEFGIPQYLQAFATTAEELLDKELQLTDYSRTTFIALKTTIDSVKCQPGCAGGTLNVLAFVHPDSIQIPFLKILLSYFNGFNDTNIAEGLNILKQYSLISQPYYPLTEIISVHRLTQNVARILTQEKYQKPLTLLEKFKGYLFSTERTDKMEDGEFILDIILTNISTNLTDLKSEELNHILSVWDHTSKHGKLVKKNSNVPFKLFRRLLKTSRFSDAHEFSLINASLFANIAGESGEGNIGDDEDKIRMELAICKALKKKGEYESSLSKLLELHKIAVKREMGEKDEYAHTIGQEIGLVYYYLNKNEESLEWNQKIFEIRKELFGVDNIRTIRVLQNMGQTQNQMMHFEDALKSYRTAFDFFLNKKGPTFEDTLTTQQNIACCYLKQGKVQDSIPEFRDVFVSRIATVGEDHDRSLRSGYWLALALFQSNTEEEREEAAEIMKKVYPKQREVIGENHPFTLKSKELAISLKLDV